MKIKPFYSPSIKILHIKNIEEMDKSKFGFLVFCNALQSTNTKQHYQITEKQLVIINTDTLFN